MSIRHYDSRLLGGIETAGQHVDPDTVARTRSLVDSPGGPDGALPMPGAAELKDYADRVAWLGFDFGRDEPLQSLMLGKGPLAILKVIRSECVGLLRLKTGPKFLLQLVENRELQGSDAFKMFRRGTASLSRELQDIWPPCDILARAYGFHEDSNGERQLIWGGSEAKDINDRWEWIRGRFPEEEIPLADLRELRRLRLATARLMLILRPIYDAISVQARNLDNEEFTINEFIKRINWSKRGGARAYSAKYVSTDHFHPNIVRNAADFFNTRGLAEALELFIKFAGKV